MEIEAIHKRSIALDMHQAMVMACAIIEEEDGTIRIERRKFGAFKRDRRALADGCAEQRPGVRLGVTVSDLHGNSARAMIRQQERGQAPSRARSSRAIPTYVRRLMCEFALAATKTRCAFQAKYKSLTIRRGHKRAVIACAHKMIRALYMMLRKSEPYRDGTVDIDALVVKRNAPRWIRALKKHGYLPATAASTR